MERFARLIEEQDFTSFEYLYNDFKERAVDDYKFELPPLDYAGIVDAVRKDLIKCLVLFDEGIPSAFLIYTTSISESIELNIIHSYNFEDYEERAKFLMKEFLALTKYEREDKVVSYPLLGKQVDLIHAASHLGFKFIGTVVLRFMMYGTNSKDIFNMYQPDELPYEYYLTEWDNRYFPAAVQIIHEAFKDSSDAFFDTRFKSEEGTDDILTKIVQNLYAEFLPEATTVLLYNGKPAGFCFVNLTNGKIANIPLFGLKKEHQGKGLSKIMLKKSLDILIKYSQKGLRPISEVNTTTETENFQALKLYRHLGFKEDYSYPQAYLR